ncbi:hypothetical protein [Desulfitobacterium hafniense]|uniref:hypothetical protein n=1 Tax=Desulfitobacterium hafniense TaxID=49338 RepID=UPI0012FA2056|nr:hypothetical protein [Desulfitobacterium hafniense]
MNKKEDETTQKLFGKDVEISANGIIEIGSIFRCCVYVTQANMRTTSETEKTQRWISFRGYLNEIGLPYSFIQLSQFVDVREYAKMYQDKIEKGNLTPELQASGQEVVNFVKSMDEDRNSRDYHGYIVFHYDPESDSIDSGVSTGNATLDGLIGKISGKKPMSDEERKNLSRMILGEAINITRNNAEQMGISCWPLNRGQVYGLVHKILQKDNASFSSPEEAGKAQVFTSFHDSLTARTLADDLQEDYNDAV